MTRARKKLHLTYARLRRRFDGREMPSDPSRFLETVPRDLVQVEDSSSGWKQTPQWGQSWQGGGQAAARPAGGGLGGTPAAAGAWGSRPAAAGGAARPGLGSAVSAGFSKVAGGLPAAGAWGAKPSAAPAHAGYAAPEDDLPTYDRSDPEAGFRVGGRAHHARFGIGQVLDIAGYGADAQLTVQFAQVGIKKIVARFLRPA
jgi:DNA helicase-2/ATP-dependent DNA helicase PcrA